MSKVNCPNCGQEHETFMGEYQYVESGLDNVIIEGIEIFKCPCGEYSALIPHILELHKTIAKCLIEQMHPLSGKEIRFLRKNMGIKAMNFARILGVDNATVSRWENGKEKHSDIVDRFIRLIYANEMGMHQEAERLIKDILSDIDATKPQLPIVIMADKLGHFTCSRKR